MKTMVLVHFLTSRGTTNSKKNFETRQKQVKCVSKNKPTLNL